MPFDSYKDSVAIYLRKSRMDPESETIDETLARHSDTLLNMAAELELNIVEIYKEVVSGDSLFTRPEMVRLLRDIEADKYSAVLCMEIDRLGRSSQKDGGIILETLQEHDVRIITQNKTYDLTDEIDEQSVEMQSFIARQELKAIRRRLRRGTEKTVAEGYHVTEPPYGYRRAYVNKKPTLEIDEHEAEIIRMVFDMYVNRGYGSQTIADTLNQMGESPRKSSQFGRTTIQWYLRNPTYIGKIYWNRKRRVKKKSLTDKNVYRKNPTEKWIISDGKHPAIVSEELFNKAQKIIAERTHPPSFTGELQNPLAGLMYCTNCGSAIVQQRNKKRNISRYLCPNNACTKSVSSKYVEEKVKQAVSEMLHSSEANHITKKPNNSLANLKNELAQLQKELKQQQEQKSKLHDFLERGIYDVDTFLERGGIISERIKNIEKSISILKKEIDSQSDVLTLEDVRPIMRKLLDDYDNLTAAEKNTMYKQIIKKIIYGRTKEQKNNNFDMSIEWGFDV